MTCSKRLLNETRFSLEKIASDVGYTSLAAFSKAFKRVVGKNPGQYRQEVQSAEDR